MNPGQIQAFLRSRREALRLSQADVAERMGGITQNVQRLERHGYRPTLVTLIAWAKALGCEITVRAK